MVAGVLIAAVAIAAVAAAVAIVAVAAAIDVDVIVTVTLFVAAVAAIAVVALVLVAVVVGGGGEIEAEFVVAKVVEFHYVDIVAAAGGGSKRIAADVITGVDVKAAADAVAADVVVADEVVVGEVVADVIGVGAIVGADCGGSLDLALIVMKWPQTPYRHCVLPFLFFPLNLVYRQFFLAVVDLHHHQLKLSMLPK